jgi:hypothetical protein
VARRFAGFIVQGNSVEKQAINGDSRCRGQGPIEELARRRNFQKGRRQARYWTGWIDAPAPFFWRNRRPRNRSFQPARVVSSDRRVQPMGPPVQKFRYRGCSTWYYGLTEYTSRLSKRLLTPAPPRGTPITSVISGYFSADCVDGRRSVSSVVFFGRITVRFAHSEKTPFEYARRSYCPASHRVNSKCPLASVCVA